MRWCPSRAVRGSRCLVAEVAEDLGAVHAQRRHCAERRSVLAGGRRGRRALIGSAGDAAGTHRRRTRSCGWSGKLADYLHERRAGNARRGVPSVLPTEVRRVRRRAPRLSPPVAHTTDVVREPLVPDDVGPLDTPQHRRVHSSSFCPRGRRLHIRCRLRLGRRDGAWCAPGHCAARRSDAPGARAPPMTLPARRALLCRVPRRCRCARPRREPSTRP